MIPHRESCVFHFSHFELYFALLSCVPSTFQQHLLQFSHNYISISKFSDRVPRSFEFHDRVNARRTKYLGDRISTGHDCSDSNEVLFTVGVISQKGAYL